MPIESRLFSREKGKTEWPRTLGTLARAYGAEAISLSWSSAGRPKVVPAKIGLAPFPSLLEVPRSPRQTGFLHY